MFAGLIARHRWTLSPHASLAVMRAIDLSCLMLSPLVAGVLMTYGGPAPAIGAIAGYSLLAWLPEIWLAAAAQRRAPALR
jgi:hypothetical protein